MTKDDKLLLTRRVPTLAYYPDAWSCSIEENLHPIEDFKDGKPDIGLWFSRALKEELALKEGKDFLKDDLRILSVFLEAEILNVSIAGIV